VETANQASMPKPVNDALRNFDQLPDSANIGVRAVAGLFNCSRVTVWRRVARCEIPKPYKLSSQARAWNVGELRAALRALRTNATEAA
jgi:predicted DNA-binding transcriptional regulator AlpA